MKDKEKEVVKKPSGKREKPEEIKGQVKKPILKGE